jgi:hypothetical protein
MSSTSIFVNRVNKVIYNPSCGQVREILHWLKTEYLNGEEGFYGNRRTIWNSFKYEELAVLIQNNETVGFIVFTAVIPIARIDICEIKQSKRKQGLGELIAKDVIEHLRRSGSHVIHADCVPASSYGFWKRFGFELINPNSMKVQLTLKN